MSVQSAKIAISLPRETYNLIEKLRHEMGLGRSAVIFEALGLWLKAQERKKIDALYVKGYKKKPERAHEHDPMMQAGLKSFSGEEW